MTRFDELNSEQRMKLKVILWDPVDKSNPSESTEPQMPNCLKTGVCLKSSSNWTLLSEAGTLNEPVFMLFKVKDAKPLSSWLK